MRELFPMTLANVGLPCELWLLTSPIQYLQVVFRVLGSENGIASFDTNLIESFVSLQNYSL